MYGKPHSEAQAGEILLCNTDTGDTGTHPYASVRLGVRAYDVTDTLLPRHHPVFVLRAEVVAAGVDPEKPFA